MENERFVDVYVGEGIGMYFGIVLSGESVPQVGKESD